MDLNSVALRKAKIDLNPVALRKAKIVYIYGFLSAKGLTSHSEVWLKVKVKIVSNFGFSECKKVNKSF